MSTPITFGSPNLPAELMEFFNAPAGHSLVVRGDAGTGKTTLALQLIEETAAWCTGFYLSTRVSDVLVLTQFPWLAEKLYGQEIADWIKQQATVSQESLMTQLGLKGHAGSVEQSGLDRLLGKSDAVIDIKPLRDVYDMVRRERSARPLVVIDSLDALAERCSVERGALLSAIQKDLVEGYGANVVFVMENNLSELDYLGDGVVVLSNREVDYRLIREFAIVKLRGSRISEPKKLFTLEGGRIKVFSPMVPFSFVNIVPSEPIDGMMSTGITDLDAILGGGMDPGRLILLEFGDQVPHDVLKHIEAGLVSNSVLVGKGVLWIPTRKIGMPEAVMTYRGHIGKSIVKGKMRIAEEVALSDLEGEGSFPLEGLDISSDLSWKKICYSWENGKGIVCVLGLDSLESIYGLSAIEGMHELFNSIRMNGGICIGIASSRSRSAERFKDLASTCVRTGRIGGNTVIYGEEPFTPCNIMEVDVRRNGLPFHLTPIV